MNEQKAVTEFDKGNQLLQEGKLEDAIAAYCCAIELNPANSWFHQHLGEALAKLGRFDEAVTAFCCAIELKPDFSWSYHHLGDALAQQQKWEQAAEAFGKGIQLNPEHFGTYVGLGNSLAKLGQLDNAIASYRRASELNPSVEWIYQALANALQQRSQSDLAETIASYRHIIELNPDNVEAYQNLLQLQPDNSDTWLQLAQAFVRQGNMEEAIASYLQAVKLSQGNFYYCQGLSEALIKVNQPHHWEQAITIYQRIISEKLNSIWVNYFLGFALQNTQQLEAACQAYQSEISINPGFFESHFSLGNCAKEMQQWEEAVTAYQRALELNPPNLTSLNNEIGEAYYQLGKECFEKNQLEKAAQCYQKAQEKQPHQKLAYYDLREAITRAYHQLGIDQAKQGLLDEAVACFQKAQGLDPSLGDVCEYLWEGLNQQGVLDETSPYCQKEIRREVIEAYFSSTCTYKIINLWDLNTDDKEYIKKSGLSLVQIEFAIRDQRSLEKIYMNSFEIGPIKEYSKTEMKSGQIFQQSIVETSYIYTVCPFNGIIVRSNQSFVVGGIWPTPVHFYRFVGQEIFYLVVGDWIGDKMYIYIPSLELIIQLRHLVSHLQGAGMFNKFKGYMVSEWKQVLSYLSNPHKQLGAVLGFFGNIGHYTWNDLTGIQYLHEKNILTKIDNFIVGTFEYFNVVDIWPEHILPNKRIQVADPDNLFQTVLANNCFTFRVTEFSIKEDLTNRIIKGSYQRCSQEFLQQIEIAKHHFPLVCFQIRFHIRFWLSQSEGIANIINNLSKDYPNLGVVFDGWSRTEIDSPGDDVRIAVENEEIAKIIARLYPGIKTYNTIGCKTYEKVLWAQAVDTYIAPSGSGLTFLSTIANKMGVVHGDSDFYHDRVKLDLSLSRENGRPPLLVPGYHLEGDRTEAVHRNYECDWSVLYDEVLKLVQSLQPER